MNGHHIDLEIHRAAHAEMRGDPSTSAQEPVLDGLQRADIEDAAAINRILNDPAVYPLISVPGQQPFEVSALLADPRNVFLRANGGAIICIPDLEPTSGIYEIHMNFLPDYRGRNAIEAAIDACGWMFTHTFCMTLVTRVPRFNRAADQAARAVGGRLWFERKAAWPTVEGDAADLKFYTLTLQDWATRYPAALIAAGHAFHERLEHEYERHGFVHTPHPADDDHDAAVGLAAEMIYGGEPEKALILYNRWARLAGYGQASLISRNPLVIDLNEALLQVLPWDRTFKVIKIR
jgi:hypothetical protein